MLVQFSHYLDLVEVELVKQISTQSKSFFVALSRLHHLRDEVTAACDEITNLRKAIRSLGSSTSQSLGVVSILQRQKNMDAIFSKVFTSSKLFLFLTSLSAISHQNCERNTTNSAAVAQ